MGRFSRSFMTVTLLMLLCASSLPGVSAHTAQAPASSLMLQAAPVFSDDFESGNLSKWTAVSGLAVQQQVVYDGAWSARATCNGLASYANKLISPGRPELFYRIRFNVVSQSTTMNLLKFRTVGSTGGSSILGLFITSGGRLSYRNDVTAASINSTRDVSRNVWHELQVRLLINGTAGQVQVWLDGTQVAELNRTDNFGTALIGNIQLGENGASKTFDVAFDDVAVDTSFISPTTPTPTLIPPLPTESSTATPTSTFTPTSTSTHTSTPGATAVSTSTSTSTATSISAPTSTSTFTPLPTTTPTFTPLATNTPLATFTAAPGGVVTVTFGLEADARVEEASAGTNFGTSTKLRTDMGTGARVESYLRFTVVGLSGTVERTTLRLFATTGTNDGPAGYTSSSTWSETGITWNNRPTRSGAGTDDKGVINSGAWVEYNVTPLVPSNGTYTLVLAGTSSDGVDFYSREGTSRPQIVIRLNGIVIPTVTPTSSPTRTPGGDPVIMAAGDIACGARSTGSACREMETSDLILAESPAAVLALGDVQYECGDSGDFTTFFDTTWGRFKSIIRPAIGNHEYRYHDSSSSPCVQTAQGAPGYWGYFGAAANPQNPTCTVNCQGYYSYDVGTWHIIALNSNCSKVGGCGAGSPQEQWLRADLAAHPTNCTLAYWHHPLFSSGQIGNIAGVQPLWQALYDNNADLVLGGHDHNYERFSPQNPAGGLDLVRGIREFVVGTGGRNTSSLGTIKANSQVRNASTFGVLKVTLRPNSYDWQFVPIPGQTFTDSGTASCH